MLRAIVFKQLEMVVDGPEREDRARVTPRKFDSEVEDNDEDDEDDDDGSR